MWVYVYSGLTSRCVTLAHAYHLIKSGGYRKLVVIWNMEDACNIHFRDVFADDMFNDIELKIIETKDKRYFDCGKSDGVRLNIKKKHFGKAICAATLIFVDMLLQMRKRIPVLVFGKNYFDYTPPQWVGWSGEKYQEHLINTWNSVQNALIKNKQVYIKAYCGIIKGEQRDIDFSVIKFKEKYWKRVNEILDSKQEYIGIHIRRTDHEAAKNFSKTEFFIQQIDKIIEVHKDVKFFLATDDKSEEKKLREIYGDRLIVQTDKKWGRSNTSEMESGIIDCLCLSKCKYILGSYTSVFSNFAAKYGGNELIICQEKENN